VRGAHVAAYLRGEDDVAVLAPRLVLGLRDGWGDTTVELPAGQWTDALTGATIDGGAVGVPDVLAGFSVALLLRS